MYMRTCVIAMGGNILSEMNRYIDSLFCTSHSAPRKHTSPGGFRDDVRHGVISRRTRSSQAEFSADFLSGNQGAKHFPAGGFDRHGKLRLTRPAIIAINAISELLIIARDINVTRNDTRVTNVRIKARNCFQALRDKI